MKRFSILTFSAVLTLCVLINLPVFSYAVQVKSSGGQTAVSSEAETEDTAAPVYADQLAEGTYDITVRSSSSMFRVTSCSLTAAGGSMSADMTLSGTAYLKLYMGTEKEAAAAAEEDCIPYTENADGAYSYHVPVEALNKEIDCAAYSSHSEKWFPRTLVFESSSLPENAVLTTAAAAAPEETGNESGDSVSTSGGAGNYPKASDAGNSDIHYAPVKTADGDYTIAVSMTGGSGKASISSPAEMTVKNGQATAKIQWSSPNYDYMVVDGLLYEPVNESGNSVFEIPITRFDGGMKVIADTTAMSQPYEIEYTLNFDSGQMETQGMPVKTKMLLMLLIIIAVILLGFLRGRLHSGKKKYDEMTAMEEWEKQNNTKPVSRKKKKLR